MVSSWWRFLVGIEITPPRSQTCQGRSNPCTDEGRQHDRGGLGAVLGTCRSATADGQVFVVRAEGAGSVQDLVRCVGADPGAFWADQDEERVVPEGNLR
jgi:hypothetical protein